MSCDTFLRTARVVFGFTLNGQEVSTNVWFEYDGAGAMDTLQLTTLALLADAWVTGDMLPIVTQDLTYRQVQVYDMSSLSGEVITQAGTGSGALAVDSEPNGVSVVASYYTNRRGRHYRGRGYWVGLTQNDVVDGILTVDAQGAWQTALEALMSEADTEDFTHVVASRHDCNSTEAFTETVAVTSLVVKRQLGSQRRRQVKV